MLFPTRIETPRLILRRPVFPDDGPLIHVAYASDPRVTRYDAWRPHYDAAETLRYLSATLAANESGREHAWLISERSTGEVLGMITLYSDNTRWRHRLGYSLAFRRWGHGLMSEAACAVVDTALAVPGVQRIWAVVDVENGGSIRILEKCGMEREGLLHRWSVHPALGHEPRDCWCYARIR